MNGGDKVEAEILEPYQLSFSDLLLSSSRYDPKRISRNVMEALGSTGPGLLCITGVLGSALLRRKLLPMARKLALLDPDKRNRILKEHHLGSDVPLKNPERHVSSFAMQLNYDRTFYDEAGCCSIGAKLELQDDDDEFKNLGSAFKELGFCMMELGLSIARVCDREIGGGLLEETLLESCTAKGRLIHYHSAADKFLLTESQRRNQSGMQFHEQPLLSADLSSQQQQVLHGQDSTRQFLIQIGESADILSKGKLRSTLHCVCRPEKLDHISRETFVVFLQPKWSQAFSVSEYTMELLSSDCLQRQLPVTDDVSKTDIHKIVPPLSSRLRDGMTFAEFSRETTKQYYGGSGLQSNR